MGRDKIRAPLKTPAEETNLTEGQNLWHFSEYDIVYAVQDQDCELETTYSRPMMTMMTISGYLLKFRNQFSFGDVC